VYKFTGNLTSGNYTGNEIAVAKKMLSFSGSVPTVYDDIFSWSGNNTGLISKVSFDFKGSGKGRYTALKMDYEPFSNSTFYSVALDKIMEEVTVNDIPLNKWINVIIRCENKTLDVYINGSIARRHILSGLPRQNYGNVFACMNGGFSGNLSSLRYFNHAIGTRQIENIIFWGPNTTSDDLSNLNKKNYNYLSFKWYTSGQVDNSKNIVV
jgi:hypothetical protein